MEQLASHGTDFHEIWYLSIFWKAVENIKIRQERLHDMKTYIQLWFYLAEIFLEWEMFQAEIVDKIKTFCIQEPIFFRRSCYSWDSVEKCRTARQATNNNKPRHMRILCWILKAIFNTYCFSTTITVTPTRHSGMLYKHCLFCYWCI